VTSPAILSPRALAIVAALAFLLAAPPASSAPDKVTWKPIADALFEIDSRPVKLWTLYYSAKDKKEHRLLLAVGARYLMIDTQLRLITEYDPKVFENKGKECEMPRDTKGLKALPAENWILRDVGTSFQIQATLKEEGRVLDIRLPKMPDFRNVLW
jgi:hypothetical protein